MVINNKIKQKGGGTFLSLSVTELTTKLTSIQPLATNLLSDTMLLRLFTAHNLPYTNSVLDAQALFFILEP